MEVRSEAKPRWRVCDADDDVQGTSSLAPRNRNSNSVPAPKNQKTLRFQLV